MEEETLLEILKNPFNYEWEVQGFGMMRTYIAENTRLQIWNSDLVVENVTDIHTHPWDFYSTILQGKIINIKYKECAKSYYKAKKYSRCLIETGENAYVKEAKEVYLRKSGRYTYEYNRKDCKEYTDIYTHKKHIPHKIKFVDGTITVLTKINISENIHDRKLAYSYVKDGMDWVSAVPRPATKEEIVCTIAKAWNCYNNEKFEQMSSTKDVDDKEEGYFNVNISNCCDTPITAHFRRCPRCIKYL